MKKIRNIGIFLVILVIYLIVGEHFNIFLKCPIRLIFHLYCPGCGSTRMFRSLLHGNFYQAFRFNPLLFISLIMYLIYLLLDKKITKKLEPFIWYFLIGIFIIYGILRNIPFFKFLAPTII